MKTLLCVLALAALLATDTVAAAQGSSWRQQRAHGDWRNNTWREQQFDQDWRNQGWRRERTNENWQTREEFERQRMPNNATDTGAASPPPAQNKTTTTEDTCSVIDTLPDGSCPTTTATTPVDNPPKVTNRPGGQ